MIVQKELARTHKHGDLHARPCPGIISKLAQGHFLQTLTSFRKCHFMTINVMTNPFWMVQCLIQGCESSSLQLISSFLNFFSSKISGFFFLFSTHIFPPPSLAFLSPFYAVFPFFFFSFSSFFFLSGHSHPCKVCSYYTAIALRCRTAPSCDVTALRCCMKVKFILTWNAVMLRWFAAEM